LTQGDDLPGSPRQTRDEDEVLDIRPPERVQAVLEERLAMERAVSTISSRLLTTDFEDVTDVIRSGLEELGGAFGVDRAYVIALGDGGDEVELAEEWCAPGIAAVDRDLRSLSEPLKQWWGEQIRTVGAVLIESVEDLGPDAVETRDFLLREGVVSVAFVPVVVHDVLRGAVGMTTVGRTRRFVDDEVELLRVVGGAWVSRIERARTERALLAATAELERRNAELERSNRELEDFAYVASHDLKSPLLVVRGFLELLVTQKDELLDDDARTWIAAAARGSDRMQQLIDDLLVFSRAGRRQETVEAVDLRAIWSMAEADCRVAIEQTGARVETGELPVVSADGTQLRQLFQNLLANALKFTRPDVMPTVDVTAERVGDRWVIAVADNGVGVAPEDRVRIFGMFTRLDETAGRPGSGIGLAICQRVVVAHGGQIWVEETDSGGARFCVALPLT
jgi:signal transduction histidine kinase